MADKFIKITSLSRTQTSTTEEQILVNTRYIRNIAQTAIGQGLVQMTEGVNLLTKENMELLGVLLRSESLTPVADLPVYTYTPEKAENGSN